MSHYHAGRVHESDDFIKYTEELNRIMEFFDGFDPTQAAGFVVSETEPESVSQGMIWFQILGVVNGTLQVQVRQLIGEEWVTLDQTTTADLVKFADGANLEDYMTRLSMVAFTGSYGDLTHKPVIPSQTSDLENDSDFQTGAQVDTKISSALDGFSESLDGELEKKADKTFVEEALAGKADKAYVDSEVSGVRDQLDSKADQTEVDFIASELQDKASIEDIPTKVSELENDMHYVTDAELDELGAGDMKKAVYDTNDNGKVDIAEDSEKLGGHEPDYFAPFASLGPIQTSLTELEGTITSHIDSLENPHQVTKDQVGLGNVPNYGVASNTEATGGTVTNKLMTPGLTKLAIDALSKQAAVIPSKDASASGHDYPIGLTLSRQSGQGYPTEHGTVFNIKESNLRFTQWYFPHSIRHEDIGAWFRHFYDADGWTDFQKVAVDGVLRPLIEDHIAKTDNPHKVTSQQINIVSPRAADIPGSQYPMGVTIFAQNNGLDNGYPENLAVVVTNRVENYRMVQACYRANGDALNTMWLRKWRPDLPDTGWTSWTQMETVDGAKAKVDAHANNKSNPHDVTKAQIGLGDVDNIRQAPKTEFDAHVNSKSNPHAVTKSQVGLGNVDNVKQASKTDFDNHISDYNNLKNTVSNKQNKIVVSSTPPANAADGDIYFQIV